MVEIPAKFWDMPAEEFNGICDRGGLDAGQCIKLWEMLGRADTPPDSLQILLRSEDVKRIWK